MIHNYIDLGFVCFPLAKNSKQPPQGTSGHLSWEIEDTQDALDDSLFDNTNVAIITGSRSRIIVIDIDPRNGGSLQAVADLGIDVNTRRHDTANGGHHLFYRYPDHVERIPSVPGKLGAGIDVKADGGYVVAPPSTLDNRPYTVVTDGDILDLPDSIIQRITPTQRDVPESHYQYPEGWWPSVQQWHAQNVRDAANASDGERDDTCYRLLVRSMQLAFTVPDDILTCEKVRDDFVSQVPYRIKGMSGKFERAKAYAERNPRPHPTIALTKGDETQDEEDWTVIVNPRTYVANVDNLNLDKLNDISNAARVEQLIKHRVRYVIGEGWLVWTGKVWQRESEHSEGIKEIVANANKLLYADLEAVRRERPPSKEQLAFVARMCNMSGIRATIEKLQATRTLRLAIDEIDAHPNLLTVENGIIDLRTGDLLPHDPMLFLTRIIPYDYDVNARADRWERFMVEVMPNHPELVAFLQRVVGYAITGEISEHAMVIHYGRGRNGKSVFLDAIRNVFGEISSVVDWSSFAKRQGGGGNAREDIARLRGTRIVTVNEGDAQTRLDEAQIKRMVSGDTLTARRLYQSEVEFKPQFLLQMATNAKPDFRGADEGLWARVKLIPWERFFEEHERDHTLTTTLKDEAQGILTWAVRGAIDWYERGLREPECVREATQEYRDSADVLGGFLDLLDNGGWLVPSEDGNLPAEWALKLYKVWAEVQGFEDRDRLNQRSFKVAMEERGYAQKRTKAGRIYHGLAANIDIPAVAQHASGYGGASPLTRTRLDDPLFSEIVENF